MLHLHDRLQEVEAAISEVRKRIRTTDSSDVQELLSLHRELEMCRADLEAIRLRQQERQRQQEHEGVFGFCAAGTAFGSRHPLPPNVQSAGAFR